MVLMSMGDNLKASALYTIDIYDNMIYIDSNKHLTSSKCGIAVIQTLYLAATKNNVFLN